MRLVPRLLVATMAVVMLVPAAASAQDVRIEPIPVQPCEFDCWWPVSEVAQLDAVEANLDVVDGSMVGRYRFHLSNPSTQQQGPGAEGRIVFPVPSGSSVTDLALSGGPETLEGKLLDADDAARIYEDIVRRLIDPALLRSLEDDLYEVRAFPVPAGEEREVSFTVTTPLLAEGNQAVVEVPWSRMSPRPADASVFVDVDVPWEVRSALAPGFDIDTERIDAGELGVSWESGSEWTPDANFRLYLGGGEGLIDTRLLAHRDSADDGYFSLLFAPVVELDSSIPRDIVIVMDRSGSMEGDKMSQAIDAAEYVLEHIGDDDRFAVVDFSRYVRSFSDELRPAGDVADGVAYVNELGAGGHTNIAGALERGLDYLDGERPGTVIFLTDGLATVGIDSAEGILEVAEQTAPDRTQIFSFGVGYDVDTIMLDSLADAFVGTSHYVTPEERIDLEVMQLFEQVSTPVLTDVQIEIDGVPTYDLAPAAITGIFAGNQALQTGRYEGSGDATVVVTGNSAVGPERFVYEVTFPERDDSDPTVAQMWAQRRVADLITELRIEGARDSLIAEIVEIANGFGIVTPYTSYLAEEPELAFRADSLAQEAVVADNAAAPASGRKAVAGASSVERLRDGDLDLGNRRIRVQGANSFVLLDDTWTQSGYELGTDAPEVVVGSDEFTTLIAEAPEVAEAAALGERVIVLGPNGWVTIVWPDVS
jgi:Ca-activated chloride channel family protein